MRMNLARRTILALLVIVLGACQSSPRKSPQSNVKVDLATAQILGAQAYAAGEWRKAQPHYEALVRGLPQDANYWFRIANIYARTERPDAAIAAYREAVVRDASNGKYWFNMGVVQLRQAANSFLNMNLNVEDTDPIAAQGDEAYAAIMQILGKEQDADAEAAMASAERPQEVLNAAVAPKAIVVEVEPALVAAPLIAVEAERVADAPSITVAAEPVADAPSIAVEAEPVADAPSIAVAAEPVADAPSIAVERDPDLGSSAFASESIAVDGTSTDPDFDAAIADEVTPPPAAARPDLTVTEKPRPVIDSDSAADPATAVESTGVATDIVLQGAADSAPAAAIERTGLPLAGSADAIVESVQAAVPGSMASATVIDPSTDDLPPSTTLPSNAAAAHATSDEHVPD